MQMPEPRDFGWNPKPLESADTFVESLPNGQMVLTIDHDRIAGVTTEMLVWWFQTFASLEVEAKGRRMPAYFVWHPRDHIGVEHRGGAPGGPLRPGEHLRIHEAFDRRAEFELDAVAEVTQLDATGIGLRVSLLGRPLMDLVHRFQDVEGGVLYRSRMVLGHDGGLLRYVVNRLILPRRFNREKAEAWLRHNVEEVGFFERFLPELYAKRADAPLIRMG